MATAGRYDRKYHDAEQRSPQSDTRSAGQHDRDRIMYSPEFRRLSGITQVISPNGNHPAHNRLTHTLEVAQIGRSIAQNLLATHDPEDRLIASSGGLDVHVVEAAALAHDMGHPPFGHVTESILNDILRSKTPWGFEGNAQTFRILTRIAIKDDVYPGLNLTRATLSAVSKYPWLQGPDPQTSRKWGAYESEQADLEFSREHLPPPIQRASQRPDNSLQTLEAQIMDWADDVAYAVHDVDDFFRVGLIPLDRLKSDSAERSRFMDYHISRLAPSESDAQIEGMALRLLGEESPFTRPFDGSYTATATLHRRSSAFIHRYIAGSKLTRVAGEDRYRLDIDTQLRSEVNVLKSLLWMYVIENRILLSLRFGYASLIEELFGRLEIAALGSQTEKRQGQRRNPRIFPEYFSAQIQDDTSEENVYRLIADFIASLTESQAIDLHHRLTGISFGKSLDQIV